MDSSLGFRVISTGRTSANMDDGEVSDGASTGFEIQGSRECIPFENKANIIHKTTNRSHSPRFASYIVDHFRRLGQFPHSRRTGVGLSKGLRNKCTYIQYIDY